MGRMRRISIGLMGVLAAAAVAGCGSDEPLATPPACLSPPSAYLTALKTAPERVLLGDTTRISDCLVEEQEPGQIAAVGESIIAAATELNRRIRRDPRSPVIVRLGYLVGAVQEAEASTGGIHRDLKLRLDSAARYTGPDAAPFPAAFERAYGEGYAAGQAAG
jgi:hypothetical protein